MLSNNIDYKIMFNLLIIPALVSLCKVTLFRASTSLNAGHPQPESYLVLELNKSCLQTTQTYSPSS